MKKFLIVITCAYLSSLCVVAYASDPLKKLSGYFDSSSSSDSSSEPNPLLNLSHLNLQYLESRIKDKLRKAEGRIEKYKKLLDQTQNAETMKEYSDKIQSYEDKVRTLKELQANLLELKSNINNELML